MALQKSFFPLGCSAESIAPLLTAGALVPGFRDILVPGLPARSASFAR